MAYRDADGIWHVQRSKIFHPGHDTGTDQSVHGRRGGKPGKGGIEAEGGGVWHGGNSELPANSPIHGTMAAFNKKYPKPNAVQLKRFVNEVIAKHGDEVHALLDAKQATMGGKGRGYVLAQFEPTTIWFLNWRQGDSTRPHDHFGSSVAFGVSRGEVSETVFHKTEAKLSRTLKKGKTAAAGANYEHNVINNAKDTASSVHAYHPPLRRVDYYGDDHQRIATFLEAV